jgi:metallo-beta-lactamase class B
MTLTSSASAQPRSAGRPSATARTDDPVQFIRSLNDRLQWQVPAEPVHLFGPVYFVGTKGLSSFLITGSQGHVLMFTGMPGSGPMIEASIKKLGFKPADIKLILTGHAHVDHVGGHAYLKNITGAKIAMIREEVPLFESGGTADFHYGDVKDFAFDPAQVDQVFRHDEEIKLGDLTIHALLTAGHTRGSATYVMSIPVDGKNYTLVFPDGVSVNPGYRLITNPSYPGIADDYRRTFAVLESLTPDIWLAPHNEAYALDAKLARAKTEGIAAWVDPEGYKRFVAGKKQQFESALRRENAAK